MSYCIHRKTYHPEIQSWGVRLRKSLQQNWNRCLRNSISLSIQAVCCCADRIYAFSRNCSSGDSKSENLIRIKVRRCRNFIHCSKGGCAHKLKMINQKAPLVKFANFVKRSTLYKTLNYLLTGNIIFIEKNIQRLKINFVTTDFFLINIKIFRSYCAKYQPRVNIQYEMHVEKVSHTKNLHS